MKLEFTKFVSAISRATDYVEAEILGIHDYHEKRIAILANAMGTAMGMDEETVYALTMAGALHDCALSEYLKDEFSETGYDPYELNMASHSIVGEEMLMNFPFYHKVEGAIRHHHDRADGRGALGMKAEETPVYGQILHLIDQIDVNFGLDEMEPDKYDQILRWINERKGTAFSEEMCRVFAQAVDYDLLDSITGDKSVSYLNKLVPSVVIDVPMPVLRRIATFFAHITDYKSHFTWRHSLGIAEKAERIGQYYGYDQEMCDKLYTAGALHDIGKLLISNDILEKPGKLTKEEYREVQNHALGTWELLHGIGGLEEICRWASLHHEKLDGSGYPFGYTADQLGKHERLMACLDIYQALVEERPYKKGLSHEEAMAILNKMGQAGQLDQQIIADIDACHSVHCEKLAAMEREALEGQGDRKGKEGREGQKNQRGQVNKADSAYEKETWRCPVCGYIYEGVLPEDFICPWCEQPGSIFERFDGRE